jgi:hypothetical protein
VEASSPATRRRQRKGNPVPGGIIGPPITANVQLKKKIGRDSQGACRQDELIDGKAPVVK